MALPQENYTKIPNILVDEYMQKLSANAIKVFLVICRKTFGWQKTKDRISLVQLLKITGIVSKQTLYKAINELIVYDIIEKFSFKHGNYYDIKIDNSTKIVLVENAGSTETVPRSTETVPPRSTETVHTKETIKEIKKKKKNMSSYQDDDISFNAFFLNEWNKRYLGDYVRIKPIAENVQLKKIEKVSKENICNSLDAFFKGKDAYLVKYQTINWFVSQWGHKELVDARQKKDQSQEPVWNEEEHNKRMLEKWKAEAC